MKRKLDFTEQDDESTNNPHRRRLDLPADISKRIHFLNYAFSSSDSDRCSARSALFVLTEFAKDEDIVDVIVDCGAVPALVKVLETASLVVSDDGDCHLDRHRYEMEKDCALVLGLLAVKVYLGEEYVDNPKLSDVTFIVEGKRFYAHRSCLLSSDIFRAMFDGGYREKEAKDIEIPNIKWNVFELMMRFIYTGTVDVDLDIAVDLLKAADQYLLDGLKRICEYTISKGISVENVSLMYAMSETFNATSLRYSCILFVLNRYDSLSSKPWYSHFIRCIVPDIHKFFSTLLTTKFGLVDP
ncbi:hypothetical protein TSUD_334050 [Trifolium subterraneum]|uniref:BTB domain-containing protein n=1 Tax=Trifolium subterraneum TaxID=3900 RepID=A0A2Z6LYI5_TRISU|nr:hypothetical protein TSUD_334050 [Trifolium subterraneum]